jgi:hypothetical protein
MAGTGGYECVRKRTGIDYEHETDDTAFPSLHS